MEIGSTIPLNVRAYDDDGVITQVEFFVNNESIGFVRNRYDGIYSLNWSPATFGQSYVYAEVTDNDANKVRTEVRVFNVGTNLGKEPSVEVAYVRKSSGLKYNVRVLVHDIIEPDDEFFYTPQFDPELLGDFSLNLMVNGVSVDDIGVNALPKYDGQLLPLGDPDISTTYYYDFTDFIPTDSGTLEISALLMSRQGELNYRQAYLSNSIDLKITDDQLDNVDAPNLPPDGVLISPRLNEFATATAILSDVLLTNDENFGKISHIRMDNIGSGYDPNNLPEIKILGGGGTGAVALPYAIDGAVSKITLLESGTGYQNGEPVFLSEPTVTGRDFNGTLIVDDGVLAQLQSFQNGAIKNKGTGYLLNSPVRVFDIYTGTGAKGYVSKLTDDGTGGVEEIIIYEKGRNYNPITTKFYVESEYGKGFESGSPIISNGVVFGISILSSGQDYVINETLGYIDVFTGSNSLGTGFKARVLPSDLRNGAIKLELVNRGQGYTVPPIILLSGGSFVPGISGEKKPFQLTAGSTVTLLADANDFDGQVESVRFYGNGEDLGVQVRKTIDRINVTANGQGYTAPPTVTIDPPPGGEDRGQRLWQF